MVGYDDSKQFAKHFRSVTGVSPIEYKKSQLNDSDNK
jgi:AraC-like DNA-binding protein